MKRILLVVAALGLVASACSGSSVDESDAPAVENSNSDTVEATTASNSKPEGRTAPDFVLALEPSGEFVLSQEAKPVYMIFWAEW
ncbi:MAG: hypothetical protein BMS9Abin12_1520 [Acidimicrobiia bacterium]|nr:MAG: hypothetical protein BMS9Abin12_1520 [Acidimicrobiia bacterium]